MITYITNVSLGELCSFLLPPSQCRYLQSKARNNTSRGYNGKIQDSPRIGDPHMKSES